ncbi:MAG: MG2 domain-containing protein [Bacteroidota bacterium]
MRLIITLFLALSFSLLAGQDQAPQRELLYVHTDRTLYQPGETVWLRAYLTDPRLRLATPPLSDVVTLQLLDPGG